MATSEAVVLDHGNVQEQSATRHPRLTASDVAPLRAEAEAIAGEINALREAARRKVWETIVETREIHGRLCDASARLEHVQLDLRERTGEVRTPAVPVPFTDFLLTEIRRFVAPR